VTTTRQAKKNDQSQSTKAVAYIRVSTPRQEEHGVSLEAQQARVRAYCELHGLDLTKVVKDPEAISAGTPLGKRKGGAEILRLVAEGEVHHVIATKLDRLFRSAKDCLSHAESWQERAVSLHLIDMGGQSISTGSSSGKLFLTMLAGFAEFERNLIGERTEAALRQKRETGRVYSGVAPFGYRARNGLLKPDAHEQAVLVRIERMRARKMSLRRIAAKLNVEQIPTRKGGAWHASTITYLLKSDRRSTTKLR